MLPPSRQGAPPLLAQATRTDRISIVVELKVNTIIKRTLLVPMISIRKNKAFHEHAVRSIRKRLYWNLLLLFTPARWPDQTAGVSGMCVRQHCLVLTFLVLFIRTHRHAHHLSWISDLQEWFINAPCILDFCQEKKYERDKKGVITTNWLKGIVLHLLPLQVRDRGTGPRRFAVWGQQH